MEFEFLRKFFMVGKKKISLLTGSFEARELANQKM